MRRYQFVTAVIVFGVVSSWEADLRAAERTEEKKRSAPKEAGGHFDKHIAPLLGRHCVECHGPTKQKGRLDLSRQDAAFAGGKSGKAIVPGKSAESLLWKNVESGEMPEDRPPLSAEEQRLLREWIDAGAAWSANVSAPLAHVTNPGPRTATSFRRLTVPEYIETVRRSVGVDIAKEAAAILPRDVRADGFNNTAYNLNVDLAHIDAYARLAEMIVKRMDVAKFAARFTEEQKLDEANMRELISRMGKRMLRGPLEKHEVESFLRVATAVGKEGGDFKQAVRFVLEAMLQSPRFIYRIEKEPADSQRKPVGPYELASRLSYILWGGPPDGELMRAADAGELSDRKRVEAQVVRMLKDPRAIARSSRFIHEWLNLDRLDNLQPNKKLFPKWDSQLAADMREETLAFFEEVAWRQKRPLSALLNAEVTFATPRLAKHYGLKRNVAAAVASSIPPKGAEGLEALYTFSEESGDLVRDVSGAGDPIDLKIEDTSAVKREKGRLTVSAPTLIASVEPPKRLINALKKSKAITIEAWITPADANQKGPARIVSLSSGPSLRNFTFGQDGNKLDVRFRTTRSDPNGQPSVSSPGGSLGNRLAHVVFTRDAAGKAKVYIDGEEKAARDAGGDLSNWDSTFRLAFGNETTKDRPWKGDFHLVAIYSRAFSAGEVRSRGHGLTRNDLTSVPSRGGLLTQGSVLTVGGDEASMVTRGLFVLQDFLAGKVEDPPPCVDTTPVPTKPGLSKRAIAETRLANQSCGGCHAKFEPLAFGLEKFDGVGAYHEKDEHGNRLRDDGEILFPGKEKPVAYRSSAELMDLLAGSDRVQKVMTRKVAQFALGRPLSESDKRIVDKVYEQAQKGGGTYASVITALVMSDLVQMTGTETKQ